MKLKAAKILLPYIRFYEETSDPSKHAAKDSKSKSDDYNKIIKELEEKLSDPHFLCLCNMKIILQKISFFVPQV